MTKLITAELLYAHNACGRQIRKFTTLFPDGAEITAENMKRATAEYLDIQWLMEEFAPEEDWDMAMRIARSLREDYHTQYRYIAEVPSLSREQISIEQDIARDNYEEMTNWICMQVLNQCDDIPNVEIKGE